MKEVQVVSDLKSNQLLDIYLWNSTTNGFHSVIVGVQHLK